MNKKIFSAILAAFVSILFFYCTIQDWDFLKKKESYSMVVLGDSIVGNAKGDTSITGIMGNLLDVSILNGAFGGTCATRSSTRHTPSFVSDHLCMSSVVEALVYKDFGLLHSSVAYGMKYQNMNRQVLPYFQDTVKQLEKIDMEKVDVLILAYGTNDYTKASLLENPKDPYDLQSFGGSLRYSIELLQKYYPDLDIILVTPIYCTLFLEEGELDCTEKNFGAGFLEDFVELECEIGNEYGVQVIDNYHFSGINESNYTKYLEDGMHPNEVGREKIGSFMASQLKEK